MKNLLFLFMFISLLLLSGCKIADLVRENQIDITDEVLALKAEKENLLAEKKKLTEMFNDAIGKIKTGEITITEGQLIFTEVNKSKDKIAESVSKVDKKISEMTAKAEAKSEETGVPWWGVLLMSLVGSAVQVKKRIALGLSEPGYTHKG